MLVYQLCDLVSCPGYICSVGVTDIRDVYDLFNGNFKYG